MKARVLLISLLSCAVIFAGSDSNKLTAGGDIVVIVNKSKSSLSRGQIKKIFTGKVKNWPGGGAVKVLLNRDRTTYNLFCSKYLRLSSSKVDKLWIKEQIQNGVALPRKVPSSVVKAMVANSTVFIGFVKRSEAGANVKIID